MSDLQISSHLDKTNISFKRCKTVGEMVACDHDLFKIEDEMHPFANYDRAYRLKCGGIANLSDSDYQGARLDMGGDAFATLRAGGVSDADWLAMSDTFPKKRWTTRIDFCFNIHGGEQGFPENTLTEWDAQRHQTKFRKEPEIYDNRRNGGGITIYYGSRNSDKLVRVYDKAAEMKLLSEAWTRVEMQLKKPHSAAFVLDARQHPLETVGRSWLMQLIDFPQLDWWNYMICGDTIEPRDARKHRDNFWVWWHRDIIRWVKFRAENGQRFQAEEAVAALAYALTEEE